MNTERLDRGVEEWADSEEGGLPAFRSAEELAYFILRVYKIDPDGFSILIEDLNHKRGRLHQDGT